MSYVYDGLGRRAEKLENGAVVATYIYNALGDLSSEIDGSAFTDFIHAPAGGGAPEERIAAVAGGGIGSIDYYHADGLGTTRAITGGAGNNLSTCGQNASYPEGSFLDYTPFGSEIADCTQSVTPVKFTGKYRDRESGLDAY